MKQYRIKTENINQQDLDDAYLNPADPIQELKVLQYLGGINSAGRLCEYRESIKEKDLEGSNISVTGTEKARIQREKNIRPGTPEWFKLWFSLPYMTGEKPIGK